MMTISFSSCSTATKKIETNSYTKFFNIPYGEHKLQSMDVFLPAGEIKTEKVVILVHGGAWRLGNKFTLRNLQNMLLQKGIASVNINYRLIKNGSLFNIRQQLDDISLSLAYADKIFNDPSYILLGESAGAHLSLLFGYANPGKISKIISLSGPTDFCDRDFIDSYKSSIAIPLLNKLVVGRHVRGNEVHPKYIEYSPVKKIANIPTLIVHGKMDPLVHVRQAHSLRKQLEQNNVPHKYVEARFAGHFARWNPLYKNSLINPAITNFILDV